MINTKFDPVLWRAVTYDSQREGLSQDEFAALLGASKQVQQYAEKLNVSANYLMGDSVDEATFNSVCRKDEKPFYKIFIEATRDQMGLNIPDVVRVTSLKDRQVRTIITHQMKEAPLPIALQLSDTLGVPLEVWTGSRLYQTKDITVEAREVDHRGLFFQSW